MSNRPTITCPACGREVNVYADGEGREILAGHRETVIHTPETPWCPGGGKHISTIPLPTDGPDYHADVALWKERNVAR